MYKKCGYFDSGRQLFDEMPERNVVSWSVVVSGFVQRRRPEKALLMFRRMRCEGMTVPNSFTLVSALHACLLLCETDGHASSLAYQVYGLIVRLGLEWNVFLVNAFLTALIRRGQLVDAWEVFDKFSNTDIVSWNAMMSGYLQYSYLEVAGFWFRMNHEGVKPNNFTFMTVLTGLAASCDVKMGMQVHAQLVKSDHEDEICVANSLADLYLKNQRLVDGFRVFDEMPARDVCSWTRMASGCLQCGEPEKALELIEEMMEMSVKPNKFMLKKVGSALHHCDKVKLFNSEFLGFYETIELEGMNQGLPSLEELQLSGKPITMEWLDQVPGHIFRSLKSLELNNLESTVLPLHFI